MSNQQTPAPLTEERLKEIEKRANAATPGPWTVGEGEPVDGSPFRHVDGWTDTGEEWLCLSSEDAAFIAKARTDIPDMLAEIHRLRAKVAEQESQLASAERVGQRTYRQLLDAIQYPDQYTRERAKLAARQDPDLYHKGPGAPTDGNQGEGEPNPSDA